MWFDGVDLLVSFFVSRFTAANGRVITIRHTLSFRLLNTRMLISPSPRNSVWGFREPRPRNLPLTATSRIASADSAGDSTNQSWVGSPRIGEDCGQNFEHVTAAPVHLIAITSIVVAVAVSGPDIFLLGDRNLRRYINWAETD